jgi:hypothetical protein
LKREMGDGVLRIASRVDLWRRRREGETVDGGRERRKAVCGVLPGWLGD